MAMTSLPVVSSAIAAMSYDEDTQDLQITFHRGGSYIIHSIAPIEVSRWVDSGSPGGYFNRWIKGQY